MTIIRFGRRAKPSSFKPRSLDFKAEYDAAATALEKATETSVSQQGRRKGVNAEIKQFKEMKKEAERWNTLGLEKVRYGWVFPLVAHLKTDSVLR